MGAATPHPSVRPFRGGRGYDWAKGLGIHLPLDEGQGEGEGAVEVPLHLQQGGGAPAAARRVELPVAHHLRRPGKRNLHHSTGRPAATHSPPKRLHPTHMKCIMVAAEARCGQCRPKKMWLFAVFIWVSITEIAISGNFCQKLETELCFRPAMNALIH